MAVSYDFTYNSIHISCSLDNGVSVLTGASGSGKSLFLHALAAYLRLHHVRVALCDASFIHKSSDEIISYCKCELDIDELFKLFSDDLDSKDELLESPTIVLLDNADLYATNELIKELRDMYDYVVMSLHRFDKLDMTEVFSYSVRYIDSELRVGV